MKRLSRLCAGLDAFSDWVGRCVAWLLLLMIGLGAYNAIARHLGRSVGMDLSSNGLLEAQWYLFSLVFLLGAGATLRADEHVRVDVVFGRFSARTRAWVDALGGGLLLLPFCGFAIVYSWPGVVESWAVLESSPDPGGLPRYPLKTVVPVAFGLLGLQGISETLKRVIVLLDRPPGPSAGNAPPREGTG